MPALVVAVAEVSEAWVRFADFLAVDPRSPATRFLGTSVAAPRGDDPSDPTNTSLGYQRPEDTLI
jgi:hypothetical protein